MHSKRVLITFVLLFIFMSISLILVSCSAAAAVSDALVKTEVPAASQEADSLPSIDDLPMDEQMDLLEKQVIEYRGLEPEGDIERILFSNEDLRSRMEEDFKEDYSPETAEIDSILYEILGFVEPGTDMLEMYVDMYSENVAGFYDFETREMVIVQGDAFTGLEHMTYAHEYTHALQDMNYDMDDGLKYGTEYCEDDSERCAALQAVIEGDASLSEVTWYTDYASQQEAQEIFDAIMDMDLDPMAGYPPFMENSLYFPYVQGLAFVQTHYDAGGWGAVDALYLNPPVTTEQILHPEKYPDDKPIRVELPDMNEKLGAEWTLAYEDVMGEWTTYLMLTAPADAANMVPEEDARLASEGWGGDAFRLYLNDDNLAVFQLWYVWDTPEDADEFYEVFAGYLDLRFGTAVSEEENKIIWAADSYMYVLTQEDDVIEWLLHPSEFSMDQYWSFR